MVLRFSISRELRLTESDVYCGVVYIPPIGSKYTNEDPFTELYGEILRYCTNSSRIILMGDLYSRTGEKEDIFCSDEFLSDMYGLDFLEQESNDVRNKFAQKRYLYKGKAMTKQSMLMEHR